MAKTEKRRKLERFPKQLDAAIRAAENKKAVDLVVLDLRNAAGFTDYFLICSGSNPRQIRAIADEVIDALTVQGGAKPHLEGYGSEWVLLDYFDFIVHIFSPEARAFYSLERLWGNATRVEVAEPAPPAREATSRADRDASGT
jgi:ribosome-associated protein